MSYSGSFTDEFQKAGLIQPISELLEGNKEWADGFLPGHRPLSDNFRRIAATFEMPAQEVEPHLLEIAR